jgi:hypothetical protein
MARPSAAYDFIPRTNLDVITGNLLTNDSDPDGNPLFLRFVDGQRIGAKQGPDQITSIVGEWGTFYFKPDGSFTYELDIDPQFPLLPGSMRIEQLTYKVSDGLGGTDVATFRMEVKGALPGLELKTIDFEDLEPGAAIPDGYEGFIWGDWIIDTDGVGEVTPEAHVARPVALTQMVSLASGEEFFLREIILNPDTEGPHSITVRGYVDGAPHPFFGASHLGGTSLEPSLMDLQWEGIDAFEITYSGPGMWIDDITVAVPA